MRLLVASASPELFSNGRAHVSQEFIMSALNGDKSRFHRERKQKLARRKRTRELLGLAATRHKPAVTPDAAKKETIAV